MQYAFSKMQALGNDFAVFYGSLKDLELLKPKIKDFSDRKTGIGFDQLLFVIKDPAGVIAFHIFNADGETATQCLNGARCVARFVFEKALVDAPNMTLLTPSGPLSIDVEDFSAVRVSLQNTVTISAQPQSLGDLPYVFKKVLLGNTHCITQLAHTSLKAVDAHYLVTLANQVGANLGFVQTVSPHELSLKTVERGSGQTLACASNALAAVALGLEEGWLTAPVTVNFSMGKLRIDLNKSKKEFTLVGPAEHVYDGYIRY